MRERRNDEVGREVGVERRDGQPRQLRREARCGALFVFFGRRQDALKVLFFDGSGMCLFYKRLDRGRFRIPTSADSRAVAITIEERELDDLLDGIDLTASPKSRARPRRTH